MQKHMQSRPLFAMCWLRRERIRISDQEELAKPGSLRNISMPFDGLGLRKNAWLTINIYIGPSEMQAAKKRHWSSINLIITVGAFLVKVLRRWRLILLAYWWSMM